MKMRYFKEMFPKMVRYRLARARLVSPGMPFNLTFSVTNQCQSRCKTCRIWEFYKKNPEKREEELSLDEIEKIFQSMGHIALFNMSGGEPFLRKDIAEIVDLACRHLKPGVVHIPTNGLSVGVIKEKVIDILKVIEARDPSIQLTVKPSLDHVGAKHDEIRGVPGNFDKVMTLFNQLRALKGAHPGLHAELGTVISRWNVGEIEEIARFVTALGVDSYRNEIAEQRSEMFNQDDSITPTADEYEKALTSFTDQIKRHMKNRVFFQRMTNAFRLVYYDLAVGILRNGSQVIPCYGGISNAHLTPYGDVWACCTLGYEKSMGNVRERNYDFKAVWQSLRAREVRRFIREGRCHCPLANQMYSNILMHPPSLLRVTRKMIAAG